MEDLLIKLNKVDKIAKASKFKRMLSLPFKYIYAIGLTNLDLEFKFERWVEFIVLKEN